MTGRLPAHGVRIVDDDGIVCHVCGGSFHALGMHAIMAHGFATADDYRAEFGLGRQGLVSGILRRKLSENAYNGRLPEKGVGTRLKSGQVTARGQMSAEGRAKLATNVPALAAKRRTATHCKRGHEFTPDNTLYRQGARHCRACIRARGRERLRKAGIRTRREYLSTLTCRGCGTALDDRTVGCQTCATRHWARRHP